jgi:hypothetical protein
MRFTPVSMRKIQRAKGGGTSRVVDGPPPGADQLDFAFCGSA